MSSKLPRIDARHLIKVVEKLGFELVRQSGSHMIYKNAEGQRLTTVSYWKSVASKNCKICSKGHEY